ncbi:TonB-dependent receptor plug domain-containing protein [Pseudomarimonas arenosa]|uniref:TonB-dependent receptor n=1 Tax=Pseudomarimonas arenosa TaxID=2774145 RepID=A0AAW3ZJV6_9GAMM|nr:TonB-dependent receptor [Pseudomarimonas arenosa]MBD8524977.1 TonB-dependent receptor [Pseudomarimonas arenosa]
MNFNRNLLSDAVRYGLAAGAVGLMGLSAAPAYAQDDTATLDRIEVTGSRIKRADTETALPVQVISRTEIEATGLNTVFDLLNNLTASDGGGLSTVTTQTNGSDGSQQISLRGLGASRTLVLVDGKRWITDIDATVDLSTIPLAIVERVEVLKDGASAIYGSDAIGGVINLITRRNFDGAQAGFYFGQTSDGDGDRTTYDLTVGATGERARAVMALSHSSQDEIFAGDRFISQTPYAGCEVISQDPDYVVGGTAIAAIGGFCGSSFPDFGRFVVPGVGSVSLIPGRPGTSPSDFTPFTNANRYNFAPVNYLQQPAKRSNLFASGSFDITDSITAYARTSYTKRTSDQQLAEVPLTLAVNGSQGPQWTIPISGQNVFNPFGVDIGSSGFRMVAAGPRSPSYDYDIFSAQAGLEGFFQLGDRGFNWDVFAQYNDGQYDSRGTGYINLFNLRNALGPSFRDATGVLRCGAPGAVIANCVPFNLFGGPDLGLAAGRITQAEYNQMVNYVSYTQVSTQGNSSFNYGGTLSGDLVELPGGMMGFAVGFEYRRDDIFSQPDTLVASGGSSDNFSEPTTGVVRVADMFLEVNAPILADLPGVQSLDISAAIRNSDYKANGFSGLTPVSPILGDPTTEKYGLRWQIFEDLLFRASWGETFRAPSVLDLFGGGRESFPQAADPCRSAVWDAQGADVQARCIAAGVPNGGVVDGRTQLRALLGGNPFSLRPESGENISFGFVYSPSWVEGLDLSIDYWKIDLDDGIVTRSAGSILSGCYVTGAQPDFCNFVERAPGGLISTVRTAGFNVNTLMSDGIDLGIAYRLDTSSWGTFGFKWDTTYNMATETNGVDAVGLYDGSPNWEWRSQFQTVWQMGDFDANWTMRYNSELEEPCFIYCVAYLGVDPLDLPILGGDATLRAGSVTYHDLQVGWNAPWKAKISVGARNVFGKEPPILQYNSFAHSFDAGYDLPGGAYYYMQYRQNF